MNNNKHFKLVEECTMSKQEEQKTFLVAWYGIADLRAAMGIGKTGPILGALLSGNFTNLVLLAYTKDNWQAISKEEQQEYADLLAIDRNSNSKMSDDEIYDFQDKFANTPGGHSFFTSWLKEELNRHEKNVEIKCLECQLSKLNDSHGIYSAALNAISEIRNTFGSQTPINLFISPGTPVMAFSWALAALANSDLNISIISSSDARKDFEKIELPYQLTDSTFKNTNLSHPHSFDAIFHLYGGQALPTVFGITQFDCSNHVLVSSAGYPIARLNNFLSGKKIFSLEINPFDPQNVKQTILSFIDSHPEWENIGFNLTGGTKLMYAGANAACAKSFGVPFYFETQNHNMLWLNDYTTEEMVGLSNIDDYLSLSGVLLTRAGHWEDNPYREERKEMTMKIWEWRDKIWPIYKRVAEFNDFEGVPFSEYCEDSAAELDKNGKATLYLGKNSYSLPYCPDFAKYVSGGWLEEYVYLRLEPLMKTGKIKDMRIGAQASWQKETNTPIQEFDVIFSDGKRLFIMECKAGSYLSADVQKLQNNVRNYGGVDARGAMLVCFRPSGRQKNALWERVAKADNLAMFIGKAIEERLADRIFCWTGNAIYT